MMDPSQGQGSSRGEGAAPDAPSDRTASSQRARGAAGVGARKPRAFLAHYARQFGTFAGLVGLCAVLWILTPHFLTVSNLLNVAQQTAINAVIAVGLTFVIISGGIDLSVGSVVAFSGIVMASLLEKGWPVPVAIAAGLATGFGWGLANGLLVTLGRL